VSAEQNQDRSLAPHPVSQSPSTKFLHVWGLSRYGREDAALQGMLRVKTGLDRAAATVHDQGAQLDALTAEIRTVILGEMALFRADFARERGDLKESIEISSEVISSVPKGHRLHSAASIFLERAYLSTGDVSRAIDICSSALADTVKFGVVSLQLHLSADLGRLQERQGRLSDAVDTYEQVLDMTKSLPVPSDGSGKVDVLMGLSEIQRQRNQIELAHKTFKIGLAISNKMHNQSYHPLITLARIRRSQGLFDEAIELADQADKLRITGSMSAKLIPSDALKASVCLANGAFEDAIRWRKATHVTIHDDADYLDEFAHITLAKTLIAEAAVNSIATDLSEGLELINRILRSAEDQSRTGSVIEILIVQALVHQAIGNNTDALASIERALTLGEPEGYVRVFLDEGDSMHNLLRQVNDRSENAAYAQELVAAFGQIETEPNDPAESPKTGLIDPLSSRELEVLTLIVSGMTNQGIADQLFITRDTVKRHVTHIYGKLGVDRRPQAIARARELSLI
jgi:LuxR family maltose regulon positive regulatory protein